jgi:hypothetical protein
VAATRPPSGGVGAVVGGGLPPCRKEPSKLLRRHLVQVVEGSSLPPCRPEPSKSLRRHLVPPGRVLPRPAVSVSASVMLRRPPTGAAPSPSSRRRLEWEWDQGRALARPFKTGTVRQSRGPAYCGQLWMHLARDAYIPSAGWCLGLGVAPGCSQSIAGMPCARRTLPHCEVTLVPPVCSSTSA